MATSNGTKKETTGISLDRQILDQVQSSEHINLSGLCNDLLDEYFSSGSATKARLEAKRDRLLEQKEHLEAELSHVQEELDRVDEQLEEHREREQQRQESIEHNESG